MVTWSKKLYKIPKETLLEGKLVKFSFTDKLADYIILIIFPFKIWEILLNFFLTVINVE